MTFWAYMLHCQGGAFYVGHTDDLDHRIAQHQIGAIPGFTADHRPVEHVWSQDFVTREEAKAAEKRIKGWSRAKKLALIRGDWERISTLAKRKGSPSTSSGQSGERRGRPKNPAYPELVEGLSFFLLPHPQTPPLAVASVTAKMRQSDGFLWLTYEVAPARTLVCPAPLDRQRTNGLWQTTCFELFVRTGVGDAYTEFNFSPSSRWAAYRFDTYRKGMRNLTVRRIPEIAAISTGETFALTAAISLSTLADCGLLALSAVIEETDGTKSYWALAHPEGKPDFHHPACFALTLAAPDAS